MPRLRRLSRSADPLTPAGHNSRVRAEEVITTHGNTDFDAFASMLAARRLYPNAVIALAGSLNRNVRDFYRLYADELGSIRPGKYADVIAVSGDPLQDINVLENVQFVMKDGKVYK